MRQPPPFALFAEPGANGELRRRITQAYREPEEVCVPPLIRDARLSDAADARIVALASDLIRKIRAKGSGQVAALMQEYPLSSEEGVALMCLAEALLRIPDAANRNALIRDKIVEGDWSAHLGHDTPLFVNAATWGLVLTGKVLGKPDEHILNAALDGAIRNLGEPAIRAAVDFAMRRMGAQFVRGQTIEEALRNSRSLEERGFRYSYDMLGEAAMTAADAERYYNDYLQAIHAIGRATRGDGPIERNGISIKLSALHPRYSRAQKGRVMAELLPRLTELALVARGYDIGLNIDAEEADRLDLSLDLLEVLCLEPRLAGWDGLGFVVQAYSKRCPAVIDWLVDLGRRTNHRLMVRLVKGAYWDTEIKRAQVDGLSGFPVYTRKAYTDIAYAVCARKLLAAPDAVFPQFATHNARTLATVFDLAGPDYHPSQYEFQCLHGMGEPLYDEVVGPHGLDRPCRIYAPVGTHETLLAYLVRRLLENGANSSFVNRIADEDVPIEELAQDPVRSIAALEPAGAPNAHIRLPADLFAPSRRNSSGYDLSDEITLSEFSATFRDLGKQQEFTAGSIVGGRELGGVARSIINPADHADRIGAVLEPDAQAVEDALRAATEGRARWASVPAQARASVLTRAADLLEDRSALLMALMVREAGKSVPNAISEIREAVDFLRYYALEAGRLSAASPLGTVACISPWNFPLSIFVGQVAAALAVGNAVIAKPAEETPLIAVMAVRILLEAGVEDDALHVLPGDGKIGAALVGDSRVHGVMFTGSTDVARSIARTLSRRLTPAGHPVPLIAETGGQNAMIVDSSALAEQVVADVLSSAFDSAGQRCSALRILCLQEEIADRTLDMLKGAMAELEVGNPDRLATDVGPVITAEAQQAIEQHIAEMSARGCRIFRVDPGEGTGTFVAPTLIEISDIAQVEKEVFGPVLHVMRYRLAEIDRLIADIDATGYGLTFGLHTRMDTTVEHVTARIGAGNIYVNRNTIGAVVGVQPFGGHGLSGTGPKAGGPLYLRRLVTSPPTGALAAPYATALSKDYRNWLRGGGYGVEEKAVAGFAEADPVGLSLELPGPVGEQNVYSIHPRGAVLLRPHTPLGLRIQLGAVIATGNDPVVLVARGASDLAAAMAEIPARFLGAGRVVETMPDVAPSAALVEIGEGGSSAALSEIAALDGPVAVVQTASEKGLANGSETYRLEWLVREVSTSINTAAAGGNADLMAVA